ncbi:MAG TPA: hypothetical protein VFO28_20555, partial [Burkholderiaceae bacterium]|nr:hypothetical protein [Burkholderiaceae bacterium]
MSRRDLPAGTTGRSRDRIGAKAAWNQIRPQKTDIPRTTDKVPMMQMPAQTTMSYPSRRPRLAFVLGSGGVRSIAAVGIAEVLEREGVR